MTLSSAAVDSAPEGFEESAPSSPDAEDDDDVVEALEDAGAGVAAALVLLVLVAVDSPLALVTGALSGCALGCEATGAGAVA